ncbi:N-acetyltransferase family protein [Leucobacter sp. cx-328]|uniref:GNAT family N-acetyltransferase n=1 Tax=unclassified Leucobacter TaxID=2621730 RepID=UPI00165DCD9E|nr:MULTISPECIES: GNAT family N-acetyltransferase [unclassified Leucobacter]MBC9945009.1 N-acetyltransferase family protein [Leucobacter sp. cx-328]
MHIRDAVHADIEPITEIYNDAVINSTAIWNDQTVSTEDRRAWCEARQAAGFPVIVAVDETAAAGSGVIAYATFGDWRAWDGYKHTVEHSIYVRSDQQRGGLGMQLMTELIARARAAEKHAMIASIESGNKGSIRLHEKLGFTTIGIFPEVGTKFGRWLDLTCMQLTLQSAASPAEMTRSTVMAVPAT